MTNVSMSKSILWKALSIWSKAQIPLVRARCGAFAMVACVLVASHLAANTSHGAPAPSRNEQPLGANVGSPESFELNEQGIAAQVAGRTEQAETLFRRAVAVDPRNLTAAFNLASVLLANKKLSEATTLLEGYVAEFDQDPGLFARLGDVYLADKKLEPALKNFERAFALDSSYPHLASRLATVYGLMNKPNEAERFLSLVVEQDPRDSKSFASLGSILLYNGKVDESIQACKQSLQISPSSEAYITLGAAYEARGDFKNSLISFQRARDLGDSRKELIERIAGLEKIVANKG